jgi:hypothetical protein
MAITALQHAGADPTRASFIKGMQQVTAYTANGVETAPIDYSPSKFGTGPVAYGANGCSYFLRLKGDAFAPLQSTPVCGVQVPGQ